METNKPTPGRIVHYFPGTSEVNKLPNSMKFAPAIVTQIFGGTLANLTVFLAEPDANKKSTLQKWSVSHKSEVGNEDMPYWDWPARD